MLTNIIDERKRPFRFKKINAVIEPTWHDNRVKNADRTKRNSKIDATWAGYAEKEHVSVLAAVVWAAAHKDEVTLYLYDKDGGIYPALPSKRRRRK